MTIASVRRGAGKPLLLIHGLGSTRAAWSLIMLALAERREVIAIDLPGHGASPAEQDSDTFAGLVRSVGAWIEANNLDGVDMAGSSMGARLVLEFARQGRSGAVVALNPGGFWESWERGYLHSTLGTSVAALRLIEPALPAIAHSAAARALVLAQLSARPWALNGNLVEQELRSFASTSTFAALLRDLAYGPLQEGPAAPGSGPVTIVWGRHDRVCLPIQAERAMAAFPAASLVWFDDSGHFPLWDEPDRTVDVILDATGS